MQNQNYTMAKIRITKQFTFETAHALYGYDGKCQNIHGHSYKLDVTVIGKPIEDLNHVKRGMVIDFGDLKQIVKKEVVDVWDHAIILNQDTPHIELGEQLKASGHDVVLVNYQPTSEKMIEDFANRIASKLPEEMALFSLKLRETETAFAEWFASDN